MKRKPPKLPPGARPATPEKIARRRTGPEKLKNPTARVLIIELEAAAETGGDKLLQSLIKDSARLAEAAPLIHKGKRRAELEAKTIGTANEKRQRKARADYQLYRKIAEDIVAKFPRLRRASRHNLARLVKKRLALAKRTASIKTIERALKK